jgi:hypothetical protein
MMKGNTTIVAYPHISFPFPQKSKKGDCFISSQFLLLTTRKMGLSISP